MPGRETRISARIGARGSTVVAGIDVSKNQLDAHAGEGRRVANPRDGYRAGRVAEQWPTVHQSLARGLDEPDAPLRRVAGDAAALAAYGTAWTVRSWSSSPIAMPRCRPVQGRPIGTGVAAGGSLRASNRRAGGRVRPQDNRHRSRHRPTLPPHLIPGVGPVSAATLCCWMPELGTLSARQPHQGARHIRGGRRHRPPSAPPCTIRICSASSAGKSHKVALVAVMRKLSPRQCPPARRPALGETAPQPADDARRVPLFPPLTPRARPWQTRSAIAITRSAAAPSAWRFTKTVWRSRHQGRCISG